MTNILIGICDDSENDTELLIQYLKIIETALAMHFEICTYSNGNDLLNVYHPVYDILFINLPMPDIDSETLISRIRHQDPLVHIMILSKTYDFFPLGFEYNIKNYFKKPLWYFKLLNEFKKYLYDDQILKRPYLWISNQHGDFKLYLHRLRYIETSGRLLTFHYGNEFFFHNSKLSDFEIKLNGCNFFRCNNSYIVNVDYIEKIIKDINRYSILLITGEKIPLSRHKKKQLKEILNSMKQ